MRLTDEQTALREMARDLFAAVSPPERLRALWDGAPRTRDVWRRLAEVGLTGLLVPEPQGGSGASFREVALVLDEAGYAGLPEPLLETVAVATPLLLDVGGAVASTYLPAVASGEAVVTVRLGDAPYVVAADDADLLLVERTGNIHAISDPRAEPVATEDRSRALFEVADGTSANAPLSRDPAVATRATTCAVAGTAALLTGVTRRLLDLSLDHARTRNQFGQPIGAFQAVQHQLVEVHVALTAATAAVWAAAGALADARPDAPHAAAIAKVAAGDAARLANTVALQVHAGIGFTWEHDLHLWLKRGQALEHAHGSGRVHRRTLASHLFDQEQP